jgi:hypothetical protein
MRQRPHGLEVTPDDYDEHGSLKPGFALWLVILYLSRHLLLMVMGAVTALVGARRGLDAGSLGTLLSQPVFLFSSAPAVAVLLAGLRRTPKGGRLPRLVWRHGRMLLVGAVLVDLGLLGMVAVISYGNLNVYHVIQLVLDGYVLWYLLQSRRVDRVFEDFPGRGPEQG